MREMDKDGKKEKGERDKYRNSNVDRIKTVREREREMEELKL